MFDFLYAYEFCCSKHVMSICVLVYNIYFVKDMKRIFIFIVCIWESTVLVKNFVICFKIFSWLLSSLLHACFHNCSYKFSFHICEQFKWMEKKNIYSCLISCEASFIIIVSLSLQGISRIKMIFFLLASKFFHSQYFVIYW